MSEKLKYERFLWFDIKVKAERFPNAKKLADKFELSGRTAQRDIEFMRDRLGAPLDYHHQKKGYFYSDTSYELPSIWFNEDNIIALSLAVRLASSIPDAGTKQKLFALLEKIFISNSCDGILNFNDLTEKISVKNIEYSKVNEQFFLLTVNALFQKAPLLIHYGSPHSKKETERTVLPLHLIQYMGSWHVIAFCTLRNELRDFALSRIKYMKQTVDKVSIPSRLPSIKEYTRKHFGIMQGGRTRQICLKFSPAVAEWVLEQIWHPKQKTALQKDGSLLMIFPVADFRELKRKILSYGSEVQVIKPKKLKDEVIDDIGKMGRIY